MVAATTGGAAVTTGGRDGVGGLVVAVAAYVVRTVGSVLVEARGTFECVVVESGPLRVLDDSGLCADTVVVSNRAASTSSGLAVLDAKATTPAVAIIVTVAIRTAIVRLYALLHAIKGSSAFLAVL